MTQILPLDVLLKILFAIALAVSTQLWKETNPEQALKYRNYVALSLIGLGAVLNPVQYFALNQPVVVPNTFALVLVLVNQVVAGAAIGASAVGIYEFAKYTPLPFRSTAEVMVAKSNETGVIKVVETKTATNPEDTKITVVAAPKAKKPKSPAK